MSDDHSKLLHHRTEFDDWRSITIGIYMALAGYGVMVGLPVISTSWVNNLGFSEVQVGYVTSADLFGLAFGAVIAYFTVAKYDRRFLAVVSAGVAIAANVLCVYFQGYEVTLALRLVAGIGAGLFTGIAVATIGGHSRPAFAFGIADARILASPAPCGTPSRDAQLSFPTRPRICLISPASACAFGSLQQTRASLISVGGFVRIIWQLFQSAPCVSSSGVH